MDDFFKNLNFPYETVRKGQDKFIKDVYNTIMHNKNILISAPTGLGKTISALTPALKIAKEKNLTIIYLTSRQTQANQAIKTIKDIVKGQEVRGEGLRGKTCTSNFQPPTSNFQPPTSNLFQPPTSINYVAFIGKRSMCIHKNKDAVTAVDFNEFCTKMKKTGKCKYYKNCRDDNYDEQIKTVIEKSSKDFMSVEEFVSYAETHNFCPYELCGFKAFKSDLVVCDFNYMFSSGMLEGFLGKIGRSLEECIVIVDEAHNLPDRIRNSHSYVLSTQILKNAMDELHDFFKETDYDDYIKNIKSAIEEIYFDKILGEKKEGLISKIDFIEAYLSKFEEEISLKKIIEKLCEVEVKVKDDRLVSWCGRVATFLERWDEFDEESFLRLIEKDVQRDKTILSIKIRCIDPSEISSKILNKTFSSILMSGTLSPIKMHRDILGIANANLLELDSPFATKNQLTLVMDNVTSKYSARSPKMYEQIAENIKLILSGANDKNAIIFFPSYDFMERVLQYVNSSRLDRKVLKEQRFMTKEQKEEFVNKFKSSGGFNEKAKVLFAITSGSFSEGLDLPNKALELVVIVGLPLSMPDIFTQAVIRHFEKKFRKGQMYGYIYPAMNKIIQAAGRCIRSESDRGAIILMDNRFLWPLYAQTFPSNWKLKVPANPKLEIMNFFDN